MTVLQILERAQEQLRVGMCSSPEKRAECEVCRDTLKLVEDLLTVHLIHRNLDVYLAQVVFDHEHGLGRQDASTMRLELQRILKVQ